MIYADHAATTALDPAAFAAMNPFLFEQFANASQPYFFASAARQALEQARAEIAACIGAAPSQIVFTSGGTESDNWAVKCAGEGRHIVASALEHHAVLNACRVMERRGCTTTLLQPNTAGHIEPEKLRAVLLSGARFVSIMLANNELGTVQPIAELCSLAHEYGALFHTDAVQAVGHIPVDVETLGIDLLSASAHKFGGPKGVGFLYIREGVAIEPLFDGGAQESGRRAGTENVAAIVGMAAALKQRCDALDVSMRQVQALEERLLAGLCAAGIVFRRNGSAPFLPGLLSLSFPGADGEAILHRMDLMDICISTGAACDSRDTQISHVLQAIELEECYARGTVRISLDRSNTVEDVEAIVAGLVSILK